MSVHEVSGPGRVRVEAMTIDTGLYHECCDYINPPWQQCKSCCQMGSPRSPTHHKPWCSTPGIEAIRRGWGVRAGDDRLLMT